MVDSLTEPLANHHRKIADKCQSCLVNSLMYFLVGVESCFYSKVFPEKVSFSISVGPSLFTEF